MSGETTRTYHYDTETVEDQQLCEPRPTVTVTLRETVTTTTHEDDGSITTNETKPRTVRSWTYSPREDA